MEEPPAGPSGTTSAPRTTGTGNATPASATTSTIASTSTHPAEPSGSAPNVMGASAPNEFDLPVVSPEAASDWQTILRAYPYFDIPGIERNNDGSARDEAALRGMLRVAATTHPYLPLGEGHFINFIRLTADALLVHTEINSGHFLHAHSAYMGDVTVEGIFGHYERLPQLTTFLQEEGAIDDDDDISAWIETLRRNGGNPSGSSNRISPIDKSTRTHASHTLSAYVSTRPARYGLVLRGRV